MAEVQIPLLDAQHDLRLDAADKLRDAGKAIEDLWLLGLAEEVRRIEQRLRDTTFTLEVVAGSGAKLIASVPD